MTRSIVAGMCFMVVGAASATAQQLVPVGVRVSVRLDESRRQAERRFDRGLVVRGEVTAESAESIWVRPTRVTGAVGISKAGIRRLYRSRGAPSRGKSLVIDGIGGAIAGALNGAIWYHNLTPTYEPFGATSRGEAAQKGAAYGAAVFGILGFLLPVEYWRRMPLD